MSRLDRILGGVGLAFWIPICVGFGWDFVLVWVRFGPDICTVCQAFASWQWSNYLTSKVPAGKKALITNIDETAVCLFQGARRGAMLQHSGDNCRAAAWLMQRERT